MTTPITDDLLVRALKGILLVRENGSIRAARLRTQAGLSLCQSIRVLLYLQDLGILQREIDGLRAVNSQLVHEYLSIVDDEFPQRREEEFSDALLAWGCWHDQQNKLTAMRLARPSRWTRGMAEALGLLHPDKPLILATSQAQRLCAHCALLTEEERARRVQWAEAQCAPPLERAAPEKETV